MEKPRLEPETQISDSPTLSQSSSGRRRSNASNSPEFEFWMIRNPSFPQPNLLSADELFVDGVLLPLDLLNYHSNPPITEPERHPDPAQDPGLEPGPGPESSAVLSPSKRWRAIFKIGDKKTTHQEDKEKQKGRDRDREKEKKKHRKTGSGASAGTEPNINIWPFYRSHSAGNGGTRPKMGAGAASRKVSSAPCSRSNSAGESKSRKWPSSPGRGPGIHVGRSIPVWQVRRGGSDVRSSEPVVRNEESRESVTKPDVSTAVSGRSGGGGRARVLKSSNVPTCIGYRQQLSCRSDEERLLGGGGNAAGGERVQCDGGGGGGGTVNSGGKLFNLRTLFSKKVY